MDNGSKEGLKVNKSGCKKQYLWRLYSQSNVPGPWWQVWICVRKGLLWVFYHKLIRDLQPSYCVFKTIQYTQ